MPALIPILGYAGLIPFVALTGLTIMLPHSDTASFALDLYAFGIIVFLCGAWWPTADMHNASLWRIVLSNVLFLVAFFALVFMQAVWLLVATALLLVILGIELFTSLLPPVPAQYRRMRIVLTVIASLSLLAAFASGVN